MKIVVFVGDVRVVHGLNRHYFELKMFSNRFGTILHTAIQSNKYIWNRTNTTPPESQLCVRVCIHCQKTNRMGKPIHFDSFSCAQGKFDIRKTHFPDFLFVFEIWWRHFYSSSLLKFSLFSSHQNQHLFSWNQFSVHSFTREIWMLIWRENITVICIQSNWNYII